MANERVAIPGSERDQIPNSNVIGTPDPNRTISVTVILRRRSDQLPEPGNKHISRDEFAERFGADPADALRVEQFAAENDLTVVETDLARRSVVLSGTIADVSEAFGTQLSIFQSSQGAFRGRTGHLYVPAELAPSIVGVFGLDERPQARAHLRRLSAATPEAAATSYTPPAVAKLYGFPATATGSGQTIALIELGGGYRSADLQTYFKNLGVKMPSVTSVSVDGARNAPVGSVNSADGEVLLDIEVAGSIANQAHIAVYFAPNTDQGFLDAITTAVHDTLRRPSVVSISWGGPESTWTSQALTAYDQAFQDAGLLGVTICVASGDSGSSDGVTDGLAHVDFPASSPNVLACGGTNLQSSGGKITAETAWNDASGATGGGVSEAFPLPSYQSKANVPVSVNASKFKGRGVPDVSGDADPASGYQIRVDGRTAVFGGTSAVAPLWAALIALLNQQHGSSRGFWNPSLYAAPAGSFHDITSGNNGAYSCRSGWDPCTGLGSPSGQTLTSLKSKKVSA